MENLKYKIRPARKDDEPFLLDMLFETLLSEEDAHLMTREMLDEPKLARYVKNWGRDENDLGFIAEDEAGEKIGAVWSRLFDEENQGYGFVSVETPELAIALKDKARGKGVGTALMKNLINVASKQYPALSLSVAPKNPAKKLYEKLGFETTGIRNGHPLMVLRFKK